MNTNYIRHRDGSIEFISAPGAHSAPSPSAAAISVPGRIFRRTAYSWYECAAAYWLITLTAAGGLGALAGFWLLRSVCIALGSGIAGVVFGLGPYLVIIAFIIGSLVYNLKCANREFGVFEGSNYALSLLTATGFGAAVIPAVLIVCAVIAAVLALILVVVIIVIIITILAAVFSS